MCFRLVEGFAKPADHLTDFRVGNYQRRTQADVVAHGADDQAVVGGAVGEVGADALTGIEAAF